jgi:hypothetical protein
MKTPRDLRRDIDYPLQRFFANYGALLDFFLCALALAVISFCAGWMIGSGSR